MAGEYKVAKELLTQATDVANDTSGMSTDMMTRAMLSETLRQLMATQSLKQVKDLIDYELESLDETEFVITRGC